MRSQVEFRRRFAASASVKVGTLILVLSGCSNGVSDPQTGDPLTLREASSLSTHALPAFGQVNLVSDVVTIPAMRVDGSLLNPWGIAIVPNGPVWLSANHSGVSVIYDQDGNTLRSPVSIPTTGHSSGGAPTGVLFNPTPAFVIPQTGAVSRSATIGPL